MADQTESGDVITQRFSGGVISWDRVKNTFSSEPANLASQLSGLQVPGQEQPKAPSSPEASDTNGNKWFQWTWWWLLAIVPVVVLVGLIAFASLRNRRRGADDGLGADDTELAFGAPPGYGAAATEHEPADDHSAELFGDHYPREGVGSLPSSSAAGDYPPASMSPWGAPDHTDEADTSQEPVAVQQDQQDEEEDPDRIDTTPTRVPTPVERDPLTDTGRHARIVVDEPAPNGTALHLPLDDPNQAPEGYPIKADTKSGLYWVPGSSLYDDAHAEIWLASEEIARTNGFVRAN
jgi:uncharacterized protein with LGFP repeats